MKFILISPKNRTAYNFRGDLVKKIIASGYEVVITGPNRDNVDKVEALGARFVEIPMNKNTLNPFKDLKYMNALRKLFKKEKPDVILGYTSKPVIYGSIAGKLAGVPHKVGMVTGAGYAFTAKNTKAKIIKMVMSMLYRIAFACSDVAIFQNVDDKNTFVKERILKDDKCKLIDGSGVNMERFPVAPLPEQLTFFMLSRVMYFKGIREYLEACSIVKEKHPEVRFMLLGACEGIHDSLSAEELKPYVEKGIIEHFGETDTVADFYKQCSVFVLPSYGEGVPRTVQEAMSMGRAIITTTAPGCRETVEDGVNGFLIPTRDGKALAEKMMEFVKNPELVEKMGKASNEYCRRKFEVNKINNKMCEYLKIESKE